MNPNWPRWIYASFAKHFSGLIVPSYLLYVEGTDRETADVHDFAEFRLDGPRSKQITPSLWRLEVTVNIYVQSTMDDKDAYKIHKTNGVVAAAFSNSISAFKFGSGPDDDREALLACFERMEDPPLRINLFGIIGTDLRKQQATIEGRYVAELST